MIKRIAFVMAFIALMLVESAHAKTIVVNSFSLSKGETYTFTIDCNNSSSKLVAFQMDLELPAGLHLNIEQCRLSERFTDGSQELLISELNEGKYRILTASYNLVPLREYSGAMIYLSITADSDFEGGEATLLNITCAGKNSVLYHLLDESFDISYTHDGYFSGETQNESIFGDINLDGNVDISDINLLVEVILGITEKPNVNCDINADGKLDISDVLRLADIILEKK